MPYVNIKITPAATPEQKAALIKGVTDLLVTGWRERSSRAAQHTTHGSPFTHLK